ncbi:MAG: methyltransferase domain-containing protein [Devosia sp.]
MVDFERARAQMVESQLRGSGVTNAPILARMRTLPRENFVAAGRRDVAYADDIQWLGGGSGRVLAAPATLAKLLKLADITGNETVLDIGAGTGYSTAVIAGLAASVTGLEPDEGLAAEAETNLAGLGLANASILAGDIDRIGQRRFDVMIVQGTLDSVPAAYFAALNDGGRLISLIRTGAVSVAHVFVKSAGGVTARAEFHAFLPPFVARRPNEEFVF